MALRRSRVFERLAVFRIAYARVQSYVGMVTFFLIFATFATAIYDSRHVLVVRENMDFLTFFFASLALAVGTFAILAYVDLTLVFRRESALGSRFSPLSDVQAFLAASLLAQQEADGVDVSATLVRLGERFDECGLGEAFREYWSQARRTQGRGR
jgi:hypothetical protein